ncbi:alpha-galactosidase [Streptococcus hyointestinalis]|uniref:alpha-galactosidase n=1 Tax=Streptococcus hyointestinalis TaxID=1337 RepID=UPI0035185D0D
MSIVISDRTYYVTSKDLSLIIEERDGDLLLRHFGRKVLNYHQSNAIHERDHAFSGQLNPDVRTYSYDTQRQILGLHGLGDFRQPSLKIQHGVTDVTRFVFDRAKVVKGMALEVQLPYPHSLENAETLVFTLIDSVAQLELNLYYTVLEDYNTIVTYRQIRNLSDEQVVIHRALSTMVDFPAGDYDVVTLQGAYAREKTVRRQHLEQGIHSVVSNRGASGHAQTPALILCEQETTESAGQAWAFQLMYSGNFQAFAQESQITEVRVGIGIEDENFAWVLEPGEQFETPVALMTYSHQGLTGLSQESQDFVTDYIIPKHFAHAERPILLNNWEATYFDFEKEKLLELADEAQAVGVELFVLDDGWFGNRFDDNRALGDWVVNEDKLGGPLQDLIEEVHARNLKFGLWFEPEMISVDSDLYRAHPDWAIQTPGYGHTYSRNQLVLNLANPEVVSYLKEVLDKILTENTIDYVKWDYNRNMTNLGNGRSYLETQQQSHAYLLGLYDLVAYLTEKHPHILFESCSGGGGRNDLGMMRYFPQVWASDNTDAIARLPIQYGSSYLYPTISMGAHVSAVPNHQMGRITSLDTRGHVAMMGNLGYELDLTSLEEAEKVLIAEQIAHYKALRPVVQFGQQYRLINPTATSNEAAVQFNYQDQVVVTYVRVLSMVETVEPTLKLKDLEEDGLYQLQGSEQVYSGAELMYAGLTVVLPQGDFLSKQYVFQKMN